MKSNHVHSIRVIQLELPNHHAYYAECEECKCLTDICLTPREALERINYGWINDRNLKDVINEVEN